MGLSRIVSDINCNFSRKLQNLPAPAYFAPALTESPLELGIGARSRKATCRMMVLQEGQNSFKICLAD